MPVYPGALEFFCLSITVLQFLFTTFTGLFHKKCNRLKARVVIYAYNHHVRLLSPEPVVVKQPQFTRVEEPTLLCNQLHSGSNSDNGPPVDPLLLESKCASASRAAESTVSPIKQERRSKPEVPIGRAPLLLLVQLNTNIIPQKFDRCNKGVLYCPPRRCHLSQHRL